MGCEVEGRAVEVEASDVFLVAVRGRTAAARKVHLRLCEMLGCELLGGVDLGQAREDGAGGIWRRFLVWG